MFRRFMTTPVLLAVLLVAQAGASHSASADNDELPDDEVSETPAPSRKAISQLKMTSPLPVIPGISRATIERRSAQLMKATQNSGLVKQLLPLIGRSSFGGSVAPRPASRSQAAAHVQVIAKSQHGKTALNGSFQIRSAPNSSASRLGLVSEAGKKFGGVRLTGKSRSSKAGQWLEVVANGKHGWISDAAVLHPQRTARAQAPAVRAPAVRAAAAAVAPVRHAVVSPPAPARVSEPTPVPAPPKDQPALPSPNVLEPTARQPIATALVAPQVAPEVKIETAPRPLVVEKPVSAPAVPAKTIECAKSMSEFKNSELLVKALGSNYNPFVKWNGDYGTTIAPDSRGAFIMHIPAGFAMIVGRPPNSPLPLQICASAKEKHAFVMLYNKRFNFNDAEGNSVTLKGEGRSGTFVREQAVN
jgi:hypothetical protein